MLSYFLSVICFSSALCLGQLIVAKVFVGKVVPAKNENKYVRNLYCKNCMFFKAVSSLKSQGRIEHRNS